MENFTKYKAQEDEFDWTLAEERKFLTVALNKSTGTNGKKEIPDVR